MANVPKSAKLKQTCYWCALNRRCRYRAAQRRKTILGWNQSVIHAGASWRSIGIFPRTNPSSSTTLILSTAQAIFMHVLSWVLYAAICNTHTRIRSAIRVHMHLSVLNKKAIHLLGFPGQLPPLLNDTPQNTKNLVKSHVTTGGKPCKPLSLRLARHYQCQQGGFYRGGYRDHRAQLLQG